MGPEMVPHPKMVPHPQVARIRGLCTIGTAVSLADLLGFGLTAGRVLTRQEEMEWNRHSEKQRGHGGENRRGTPREELALTCLLFLVAFHFQSPYMCPYTFFLGRPV